MVASRSLGRSATPSQNPAAVGYAAALGLVALGGAAGTLFRYGLGALWVDVASVTLAVNLAGAFGLGALVAVLGRAAARSRSGSRAERLRLLLGAGVLGGFTTYSGLATEAAQLLLGGDALSAVGYAGLTLVGGLVASLAGIWVGGLGVRREARAS